MLATSLLRHIEACHTARLPGSRLALRVGTATVGWIRPADAALLDGLRGESGAVVLDAAARLPELAARLAALGRFRLRGEAFDVRALPGGPVLARVDRGALPLLGIAAEGVHVNGLVHRRDGLHLWVARRSADKALDPGKLDHIVAGGVPAGLTPAETLIKEAAEEAGIPATLAARARAVGEIAYAMERPEGLRRDRLHLFDLELPDDFTPVPMDGEVAGFELWPLARVIAAMRETDDFKFNVNLVLIDLALRLGAIDPAGREGRALRAALDAG